MQAAESCPIAGPCAECDDTKPHHCALACALRWEPDLTLALELALDGVLCEPGVTEETARELLLARLCRAHRTLAAAASVRSSARR